MNPADYYTKLTADARNAVARALHEAQTLRHKEVAAGHLLLGLWASEEERVGDVLRSSGIHSLQQAREAFAELVPRAAKSKAELRLADEVQAVLDSAVSNHDQVSASILCESLLTARNTATELLDLLEVDRQVIRACLRGKGLGDRREDDPSSSMLVDRVHRAVECAELLAAGMGRGADDGDVAVALIDDRGSSLAQALAHLGISRERLEEALADTRPRPELAD